MKSPDELSGSPLIAAVWAGAVLGACAPTVIAEIRPLGTKLHYAAIACTLLLPLWPFPWPRSRPRFAQGVLLGSMLLVFLAACVSRYLAVELNAIDFGIFDRILDATSKGRFLFSPAQGFHYFVVHQAWILYLLAPLKLVFQDPVWLQVLQAFLLWSPALVLLRLARLHRLSYAHTLWLTMAYLTSCFVTISVSTGFRLESLYPLAILSFLYAFDSRSKWMLPALIAYLAIKEDAAFYTLTFGIFHAALTPRRRDGALIAALSAGALVLDAAVARQVREEAGVSPDFFHFWGRYGTSMGAIAAGIVTHPLDALRDIAQSGFWRLYLPFAFLPLVHLPALVASLPGIVMLGTAYNYPGMHTYGHYYALPLVSFAFYGLLHVIPRLPPRLAPWVIPLLVVAPPLSGEWNRFHVWKPDAPARKAVQAGAAFAREQGQEVLCAAGVAYTHLPPDQPAEVLTTSCPGTYPKGFSLFILGKDPYPLTKDQVTAFLRSHGPEAAFRSGPVFVFPSALAAGKLEAAP